MKNSNVFDFIQNFFFCDRVMTNKYFLLVVINIIVLEGIYFIKNS